MGLTPLTLIPQTLAAAGEGDLDFPLSEFPTAYPASPWAIPGLMIPDEIGNLQTLTPLAMGAF